MKTVILGSILTGGLAIGGWAHASMLVTLPSQSFHAAIRSSESSVVNWGAALYNSASSGPAMNVFAPLPHLPLSAGTTDYEVYFDGKGSSGGTGVQCGVITYDTYGNGIFANYVSAPVTSSTWETHIHLTGAELPIWAYSYVMCSMPPNASGGGPVLFGVALASM